MLRMKYTEAQDVDLRNMQIRIKFMCKMFWMVPINPYRIWELHLTPCLIFKITFPPKFHDL